MDYDPILIFAGLLLLATSSLTGYASTQQRHLPIHAKNMLMASSIMTGVSILILGISGRNKNTDPDDLVVKLFLAGLIAGLILLEVTLTIYASELKVFPLLSVTRIINTVGVIAVLFSYYKSCMTKCSGGGRGIPM